MSAAYDEAAACWDAHERAMLEANRPARTTLQRLAEARATLVARIAEYDAADVAITAADCLGADMGERHEALMWATERLERAQLEHSLAVSAHLLAVAS